MDGEKESCREERICIPEFSVDGYVKAAGLCEDEFRRRLEEKSFACYAGGEAEDVITVVLLQDEIVGFAMGKIDGNPMRFGPIGICEKVRNAGIGGILFQVKQQEMCSKGIYHLYFLSTDAPGRRFYERHGVHVFRTYRKYQKSLKGTKA